MGNLMIAGDGYAYMVYSYLEQSYTNTMSSGGYCNYAYTLKSHLRLLRVATDGTFQKIAIRDWTEPWSITRYWIDQSRNEAGERVDTVKGSHGQ